MIRTAVGGDVHTASAAVATLQSQQALLHTLQKDNNSLRQQLRSDREEQTRLRDELQRATARVTEAEQRTSAARAEVGALQKRCQCLAEHLAAAVRGQQASHTANVFFLLRTQQEERHFLQDLLQELCDEFVQDGAAPDTTTSALEGGAAVHASTLSSLLMRLATGLRARRAAHTLRQAHLRLALGRAEQLTREVRQCVERVARTLYTCGTCDDDDAALSVRAVTCGDVEAGTPFSGLSTICHARPTRSMSCSAETSTTELHSVLLGGGAGDGTVRSRDGRRRGSSGVDDLSAGAGVDLPRTRQEEWHWCCDVLKACVLGMGELQHTVRRVCYSLDHNDDAAAATRRAENAPALTTVAEDEGLGVGETVEQLLREFVLDLNHMVTQCTASQERVARRLAHEVERHSATVRDYEERLRLLAVEQSKLMDHLASGADAHPSTVSRDTNESRVGSVLNLRPAPVPQHAAAGTASPLRPGGHGISAFAPVHKATRHATRSRQSSAMDERGASPELPSAPSAVRAHAVPDLAHFDDGLSTPLRRSSTMEAVSEASTPHSWRAIRDAAAQ